jgi:ATP-dependent helicase HrpA
VVIVMRGDRPGKTTQPKICLDAGRGLRGSSATPQPRRIAARAVARESHNELDLLGERVDSVRSPTAPDLMRG